MFSFYSYTLNISSYNFHQKKKAFSHIVPVEILVFILSIGNYNYSLFCTAHLYMLF